MTTKTMYATRDFRDAGSERAFAAGEPIRDVSDGEMANYAAAGLASPDKPKAPAMSDTKGGDKPA